MGNGQFIYGRSKENGKWLSDTLAKGEDLMKKFKHCVYCFGTDRRFDNCKAIYLYHGRTRLIKAELTPKDDPIHLMLYFSDKESFKQYQKASEQLLDIDQPLSERVFQNRWRGVTGVNRSDGTVESIYQKK